MGGTSTIRSRSRRKGKPESTGSGSFLSFEAFLQPKRKILEGDLSWVEPLKPGIWNLFDI
jgi:hypothetical protein